MLLQWAAAGLLADCSDCSLPPVRLDQTHWDSLVADGAGAAGSAEDLADQIELALFDHLADTVPGSKRRTCGSSYKSTPLPLPLPLSHPLPARCNPCWPA